MAIRLWRGDAQGIAQVVKVTPSTVESGDTFTLTINRKDITVTADPAGTFAAAGTDTQANLVHNVISQFVAIIGTYGSGTTTIAEFREIAATGVDSDSTTDGLYNHMILTGAVDGRPFAVTGSTADAGAQSVTVTTLQAGDSGTNEKQVITIPGTATSGTFTLTFKGQTTGSIAYNASAATVETAFEALSSVGAGNGTVSGSAGGPWTVEFTGTLAATDQPVITADGSSLDGNHSMTVTTTTEGGGLNHIFDISRLSATQSQSITRYTVTIQHAVGSSGFTWFRSSSIAAIQADLDTAFGSGQMTVRSRTRTLESDENTVLWEFEWQGTASGSWTPGSGSHLTITGIENFGSPITPISDYARVNAVQDGTGAGDEVQEVTLLYGATGGTFTLTFEGQTTGTIAYNASAATVEAALEGLSTIDGCTVTGDAGGPWTVTFDGSLVAGRDVEKLTYTLTGLTGSAIYVATTQTAVAVTNEKQLVTISSNTTGGTFTLTWDPGGGDETTGNIAFDASAATVQAALEALATPGAGDFSVTGGDGGPWTVEFATGGSYAGTDVNEMTGDGTNLTGAGSQGMSVTTTTTPTGPNWFSEAENWQTPGSSTATAPTTGDTVVFQDSDVGCLYGLEDLTAETFAEVHIRADYTGDIGLPSWEGDYWEYRPTALQAGMTLVVIGEGDGAGSTLVRLDGNAIQTTLNVHQTGNSPTEEPAVIWKGTHASNAVNVFRGELGIGTEYYGDAAAVATLKVGYKDDEDGDARVDVGVGVTALGSVIHLGGQVSVDSNSSLTVTSWTKYGGTLYWQGEGAITTLLELEGTTHYESSGTLANLEIGDGGSVWCVRDMRGRTFTNVTMEAGSGFHDPSRSVTLTNGIILRNCGITEVVIDVGYDVKLTIAAAP